MKSSSDVDEYIQAGSILIKTQIDWGKGWCRMELNPVETPGCGLQGRACWGCGKALALEHEVFIACTHRHPATRAQTEFWNFVQEPDNLALLERAA